MRSPGMKRSRGVKRCAPTKSRVDEPNGNIYAVYIILSESREKQCGPGFCKSIQHEILKKFSDPVVYLHARKVLQI